MLYSCIGVGNYHQLAHGLTGVIEMLHDSLLHYAGYQRSNNNLCLAGVMQQAVNILESLENDE